MPKFTIRSRNNESSKIDAPNWSTAVGNLVGRLKVTTNTVNVNLSHDGTAEVWQDGEDELYHLDTDEGVLSEFDMPDVPTVDLWDAPVPGSGATAARQPKEDELSILFKQTDDLRRLASDALACEQALNFLLTHIPAESGSVLLAEGAHLRFTSVRGPHSEQLSGMTIPIDVGIAGAVATSGRSMLIREARKSPQHDHSIDQNIDHITRTLLAVPIQSNGTVLGVLELLNPFGDDTFLSWHQDLTKHAAGALAKRFLVD